MSTENQDARRQKEASAKVEEMYDLYVKHVEQVRNDVCPHCQARIENMRQVGRCVYASPCGHRLYQGRIK